MNQEKIYGILLAGGTGSRMRASVNKVLLQVGGTACIAHSAAALAPFVNKLFLVGRKEEEKALQDALSSVALSVPVFFVPGGSSRQDSVKNGLLAIREQESSDALILIHDGARCLVNSQIISGVVSSLLAHGSGVAAVPVSDTIRRSDADSLAGQTIDREGLYAMQTPQGFRLRDLLDAFSLAEQDHFLGTDDASVMMHAGFPVYLTQGSRMNIKLTTQEDLQLADAVLSFSPKLRVGQGYDVHRLTEHRRLILCGVEIPYTLGLLGHSDADVALHALMDALLGAAGMEDIGHLFPDTDDAYKDIDSMKLLASVMDRLHASGFSPVNADVTIVAQKPKLAPFISQMRNNLASSLGLSVSDVNVKATTTEHLGFEGRMEGISAYAVCLLQSRN